MTDEHPTPAPEEPVDGSESLGDRLRAFWNHPWTRRVENVVILALFAWAAWRLAPQAGALLGVGPVVGQAPDFTVVTLEGDTVTAADLRGKVAVVNFWATWCTPCRLEMPALQDLHEEHADEGLVVLGLSTDVAGRGVVRDFLAEREYDYPVAMAHRQVRRAFGGLRGTPETFLIDRNGVIRHRVFGLFAPPALRVAVRRLLDEEPEAQTPAPTASRNKSDTGTP